MSRWKQATAVTAVDETTYAVDLDPGWAIGGNPHGGYLMGLVARAATAAADTPHPLAVTAHFLRPPKGGQPAEVRVEVVKRGRTASTVRATLWQDGKAHLDTLITAGTLPTEEPEYAGHPMPELLSPEECRARQMTGATIELADHVDVRIDPRTSLTNGGGTPVIRGWLAFRDGSDIDVETLLLAVDVAPPTVAHLGYRGWAPTVELSCLLRSEPAPGWLAFEAGATQVNGMWFDEGSTIWDSTGRMVAQSRQLALVGRPG
jgi:acyl-coenzyme A thioesterase PaaI-like protein